MTPRYKDCGEFIQSVVRAVVALIGAVLGIAATSLYVWMLFAIAGWLELGRPTKLELATFGFEAFAIWWATMVATAEWLYARLDAPLDDFREVQHHREFILVARTLVAVGLIGFHAVSRTKNPRAALVHLTGIIMAVTIVSPIRLSGWIWMNPIRWINRDKEL